MTLAAHRPSQELIDLVGALDGTWHGRTAMCRCPAHADRTPSLSLRQGDRGILVTCFAGCDRSDVLRALRQVPLRGAFTYSGYPAGASRNVQGLWDAAVDIHGTIAERYLAGRWLGPPVADVRFHPRCPYRPRPWTRFEPALLVAVREGSRLTAIQRVFLDPITARCRAKVMLGRPGAGAWRGGGEASPALAIAEGFETARAFSILHGIGCWASLGARRLHQLRLPGGLTRIVLAQDNDAEGRRAADRAALVYAAPGLTIERAAPPATVKDWAQWLEECSAAG